MEVYLLGLNDNLQKQLNVLTRADGNSVFESLFMDKHTNSFIEIARYREYLVENRDWDSYFSYFKDSDHTKEDMENLFLQSIDNTQYGFIINYIQRFGLDILLEKFNNSKKENIFKLLL